MGSFRLKYHPVWGAANQSRESLESGTNDIINGNYWSAAGNYTMGVVYFAFGVGEIAAGYELVQFRIALAASVQRSVVK